jgi:hypothetical protein
LKSAGDIIKPDQRKQRRNKDAGGNELRVRNRPFRREQHSMQGRRRVSLQKGAVRQR